MFMTSRQKAWSKLAVMAVVLAAVVVGHFIQTAQETRLAAQEGRLAAYYASELQVEPLVRRKYISEEREDGERTTIVKDVAYAVLTNPTRMAFCRVSVRMNYTANGERSVETAPAEFEDIDHLFLGPGETQPAILGGYDPSAQLKVWGISVVSAMPCRTTGSHPVPGKREQENQ